MLLDRLKGLCDMGGEPGRGSFFKQQLNPYLNLLGGQLAVTAGPTLSNVLDNLY